MTIRRHQYRDIINKEILQLSEKDINNINVLSPYTLLYLNKPLRRYTERKSDTQGQRYVLNHTIKINLGQGLLHAIVFNTVLDSIVRDKKINKLFLKMDKPLIYTFLSCYTINTLNDGFFTQQNVLKYKPEISPTTIRGYFAKLLNLSLIEQAPTNYIFAKTGKISKHINTAKEIKYYRFTAQGRAEIKKFIKVYTKKHEQITGNIYLNDLEKLKTNGFDEDF